uniref:BTB domain-containing protein n=1 Tax=Meloidogyne javanica TaxID=6303 RepID=A0A915LUJ4_MELJA
MRYINENYRGMPLFKDGDLEVCATKYDQEPFAWVHLALLSGANPVKEFLRIPFTDIFADFCKTCGFLKLRTTFALSDDGTLLNNRIVLKDHDITKEQFLELLYQIYRTGRPISSNLENLSIAATKLDCEFILWKLCRFMAGNSDELNFIEKVKKL